MKYEIKLKKSALKQLSKLDKKQAQRILIKVYLLADNPFPSGAEQLSGQKAYRIRVGDYRVIYLVHNKQLLIYVVRVGHRKEVYKN